jgi:RNA polymerase subunit RPABC4/transcription elongation factor Spt4
MYCTNCGSLINEGEHICKGCGKLSATMREELLAFSEKTNAGAGSKKCKSCDTDVGDEHHFCSKCGAAAHS